MQQPSIGCTVNFERKGFVFDLAVNFASGGGKGHPIVRVLSEVGDPTDFEFIPLSESVHWIDLEDNIDISIPTSIESFIQRLTEKFPEESKDSTIRAHACS